MKPFTIGNRKVGPGQPVYVIAELSANHNQNYDLAVDIIKAAKEAGADAVKLQTYRPDTITVDCRDDCFKLRGTLYADMTLYELYQSAYTPWRWHGGLKKLANSLGLDLFSSPFDPTAVDFLQTLDMPVYKIASPEIIDIPLLEKVSATGKPVIMSTGMASLGEIEEALGTLRGNGCRDVALLKCTSAYPAAPEEMNLATIGHLARTFGVVVGLSDHTLGTVVPVAAVASGAAIIEKHFTLSRDLKGPDAAFSLNPEEFRQMVQDVHIAEKAMGNIHYGIAQGEKAGLPHRRSLFFVRSVSAGELLTEENVRSIRPGNGLHPRELKNVIGKRARQDCKMGTPLSWDKIV